jgi:hypothetical protein
MRSTRLVARILVSLWTSAVLTAAIDGCSSGGTGGTGSTECASVVATLCEKACSCSGDGACRFLLPAVSDGGSMVPFSDNTSDGCMGFQLECSNVDLAACQSGLAAAQCSPYPDDSGAQGVVVPAACAPLL